MNWQVNYALEHIRKVPGVTSAVHLKGDSIKISVVDQPVVLAAISDAYTINARVVQQYCEEIPKLDFLCGYRKECVWEGAAITHLEDRMVGWGNAGTLSSAVVSGNAKIATHKDYFFSHRLLKQKRSISHIEREFDRIVRLTLSDGRTLRVAMLKEYEPTADAIRTLWDRFGPVDIVWNINPNGTPTLNSIEAGKDLGCEVMKWEELKERL